MIRLSIAALLFSATAAAAFPVTVQSCDLEVTFDAPPERAISNDVNLTEMMLVLGLRDRMVGYTGISGWKTLDAEMREGTRMPRQQPALRTLVQGAAFQPT